SSQSAGYLSPRRSFPTRRSSDLSFASHHILTPQHTAFLTSVLSESFLQNSPLSYMNFSIINANATLLKIGIVRIMKLGLVRSNSDRNSPPLHSSHVSISDAVFRS